MNLKLGLAIGLVVMLGAWVSREIRAAEDRARAAVVADSAQARADRVNALMAAWDADSIARNNARDSILNVLAGEQAKARLLSRTAREAQHEAELARSELASQLQGDTTALTLLDEITAATELTENALQSCEATVAACEAALAQEQEDHEQTRSILVEAEASRTALQVALADVRGTAPGFRWPDLVPWAVAIVEGLIILLTVW